MATSLNSIIEAIKDVALCNGFKSVEEYRINLKKSADTELPRLFIRLTRLDYGKLMIDSAEEDYKIELIIIMNTSPNPISQLKSQMDLLLNKMFTTNNLLANMVKGEKIKLVDANLTNDRDLYSQLGGEGVTLKLEIKNANLFNGSPCC